MTLHDNNWILDLPDLIRLNQLIRRRIDRSGFNSWYRELNLPQKRALVYALFEFAYQAGVDEEIYDEALRLSGLSSVQIIEKLSAFLQKQRPDFFRSLSMDHAGV